MQARASRSGLPSAPREVPDNVLSCAMNICNSEPTAKGIEQLAQLLLAFPELVFQHGCAVPGVAETKSTLLYTAARANNRNAVTELLLRGADPNLKVQNHSMSTAMHVGCFRGNIECVRTILCLSHFAYDVDLQNSYGETCISVFDDSVTESVQKEIVALCCRYREGEIDDFVWPQPLTLTWRFWFDCFDPARPAETQMDAKPLSLTLSRSIESHIATMQMDLLTPLPPRTVVCGAVACTLCLGAEPPRSLVGFPARWYVINADSHWEPLSLRAHELIAESRSQGNSVVHLHSGPTLQCDDVTYDLDLDELTSTNRKSLEVRPLMHIRDDGLGEFGSSRPPIWFVRSAKNISKATATFFAVQQLEAALSRNSVTVEVAFSATGRGGSLPDLSVTLIPPVSHSAMGTVFRGRLLKSQVDVYVERYIPTAFVMTDKCTLLPLPREQADVLQLALAAQHSIVRDQVEEFNIRTATRSVIPDLADVLTSPRDATPFLLSRPRHSEEFACVPSDVSLLAQHAPTGFLERYNLVVDGSRATQELSEAIATGHEAPTTRCALALINIVVHRFHCVVKGGIVADCLVAGRSSFKDVDIELPSDVNFSNWRAWVTTLQRSFEVEYGCMADQQAPIASRHSPDPLSGVVIRDAIITLRFVKPPVEFEMVPPWNIAYNPPRNVDFSVNNLRIVPPSRGGTSMALLSQNVPLGLTFEQIFTQIRDGIAFPIYDVVWVESSTGEKQVEANPALSVWRKQAMSYRLRRMKQKGYRLVEFDPFSD